MTEPALPLNGSQSLAVSVLTGMPAVLVQAGLGSYLCVALHALGMPGFT